MNTKKIATIGIFSAMAFILHMLSFPLVPGFNFLKIDFSCVSIFTISLIYSSTAGILTAFIKSSTHAIISQSLAIGEIFDFFLSSFFILCMNFSIKIKKNFIESLSMATILTTVVSAFFNYFIMLPSYLYLMNINMEKSKQLKLILNLIVPFNLLKFSLMSFVTCLLFKKIKSNKFMTN
ncbi:MAG: ECF transporter S component [Clostridiales bacterium]|jgi:riboflavin transporter FmnP|nr:ECF transporter S component [Clostridiales bacterium]